MYNGALSGLGRAGGSRPRIHPDSMAAVTDEDPVEDGRSSRLGDGAAGSAIIGYEGSSKNLSSSTVCGTSPPGRNRTGPGGRAEAKYAHVSRFVNQTDTSRRSRRRRGAP